MFKKNIEKSLKITFIVLSKNVLYVNKNVVT